MSDDFQIVAKNANAPFTLKLHRGDGMTLLAMDWKDSEPPRDFVGFALEYKDPESRRKRQQGAHLQPPLTGPEIPLGALPRER
jgi:hypothetical protein